MDEHIGEVQIIREVFAMSGTPLLSVEIRENEIIAKAGLHHRYGHPENNRDNTPSKLFRERGLFSDNRRGMDKDDTLEYKISFFEESKHLIRQEIIKFSTLTAMGNPINAIIELAKINPTDEEKKQILSKIQVSFDEKREIFNTIENWLKS